MKNTTIAFLLLLCGSAGHSQTPAEQWSWNASVSGAFLHGGSGPGAQALLSIEAVASDRWGIGASTGFDYYGYRSLPLAIDLRRYFPAGSKRFFAHASGGPNLARPTGYEWDEWPVLGESSVSGFRDGIYGELGAGYILPFKRGAALFAEAGYSVKTMGMFYTEPVWNGTGNTVVRREFDYTYRRLLFRIGYRF